MLNQNLPEFLKFSPDQVSGSNFLMRRPSTMLADVPGLGKTSQCIHAFDCSGSSVGLVLCPPVLCVNWAREIAQWSFVGHKTTIIRKGTDTIPVDGIVICSYDIAIQLAVQKALHSRGGDWLFLDEAHRLKNPASERAKAVFKAKGIARNMKRVTWITGTPAPNNASEFFTFLKSNGQFQGNRAAFISAFCETRVEPAKLDEAMMSTMNEFRRKAYAKKMALIQKTTIIGNKNIDQLKALLQPVYLRRTEIKGLPSLIENIVPVEGGAEDLAAIEAATTPEIRAEIERAIDASNWQFFDTPHIATIRKLTGLAKAQAAGDMIVSELDDGEPAIIAFALHTAVIERIAQIVEATDYRLAIIDGATSKRRRQEFIDAFQAGFIDVLLCQLDAASEGITLTRSSRVIICEAAWTPAKNDQGIARSLRRGQTSTVRATYLALYQSIDENVFATLRKKRRLLSEIV